MNKEKTYECTYTYTCINFMNFVSISYQRTWNLDQLSKCWIAFGKSNHISNGTNTKFKTISICKKT